MQGMMQDLAFAIPGVDEAMGFAEIMKCRRFRALLSRNKTNPFLTPLSLIKARQVDGIRGHRL